MTTHRDPRDMQGVGKRIKELRARAAPLDMTGDQFRSLGHDRRAARDARIATAAAHVGTPLGKWASTPLGK